MASANEDVAEQHIDDVIHKLDLASVGRDGDQSSKKSSSVVDNLKKLLPTKESSRSEDHVGDASKTNGSSSHAAANDDQRSSSGSKSSDRKKILQEVKVDRLPQGFVCKYVGWKPCGGLWGVRHTRQPVDQLVTELRQLGEGQDLPLVNVKVSGEGLKATLHCHDKSGKALSDPGLLPLQFISYAVQDPRYPRIFVFILVREMSSRQRKTECHAYLCASDVIARKMALSMALAFGEFSKKLEGKPHKFQVDLRNTDELESELAAKSPDGSTCAEFDA